MKKNYYIKALLIVFTISTLLSFQSCNEDILNEENLQIELNDTPVVNKLIEMGYKRESIEELDDFYLVQGDLMFSKNLVSQVNVASMWVYIDPSLPTSGSDDDYWIGAIYHAMKVYREVSDCRVMLLPTSYSSDADIIIKSDNRYSIR